MRPSFATHARTQRLALADGSAARCARACVHVGVLERAPQLLLLPSLPAAAAAATATLAALSPRAERSPREAAADAAAALRHAPDLIVRLPSFATWNDLPMEIQNYLVSEHDEWDNMEERQAMFDKEWAGR